ncbi:MAG: phenylalanine--tRNA ligase subunit beta, partial [Patescibacteria group bacterium]
MLVSFNILKKLIIKLPTIRPKQLDEILTMSVVEVESVVDQAQRLEKTVVGVVEKVAKHPNADKLKLATVNIGNKSQDVVCGGVNLRVGMKVAFARVGALVKWHGEREFTPLESATIRGVKSNGMACSAAELGLIDDNEPEHGIMDLSYLKAKPGTSLSEALGKNDLIIEIDNKSITHRPDLWG